MADLYLDHDVSLRLAHALRSAGHLVTTARGLGLGGASDDMQLLTAAQNSWTLITANRRDFRLLHDAWSGWPPAFGLVLPPHPGILVLEHARPEEQLGAVEALLAEMTNQALEGQLFWWRRWEGWRHLIGGEWELYRASS